MSVQEIVAAVIAALKDQKLLRDPCNVHAKTLEMKRYQSVEKFT